MVIIIKTTIIINKIKNFCLICLQIQADIFPFSSFPSLLIETSVQKEKGLSNDQTNDFLMCNITADRTLLSSTCEVRGGSTMYLLAESLSLLLNY